MSEPWVIELLSREHQREPFDCGEDALSRFLKELARQNAQRDISRTYVLVFPPSRVVVGYYTVCSGSIEFEHLPAVAGRGLPRYPIPTAHLARLAVDKSHQGRGLGGVLLVDALRRAERLADQIGICAVTVDALHERARDFYLGFGFQRLLDDELHLYMMMGTIRKLPP